MNYACPTLQQIAGGTTDATHQRLAAMPPGRAKWFLNQLHLHGKISATDLSYWLNALDIDPSL